MTAKIRLLPCLLFVLSLCLTGAKRPNVLIITASNLGFSDLGCYGGEIKTPVLDRLAGDGMQLTQFYTCGESARTQTALMTGQYPHRVGMGIPMTDLKWDSYRGSINDSAATLGELFRSFDYHTFAVGKWSFAKDYKYTQHRFAWPTNRGFEKFFGTILTQTSYFEPKYLLMNASKFAVAEDFYYSTAIAKEAIRFLEDSEMSKKPFFLYVAFTAPAWPLHAPAADLQTYRGKYVRGWDSIREARFDALKSRSLIFSRTELSPRDKRVVSWNRIGSYAEWQARRMEAYAAQVTAMDRSIGLILNHLRKTGQFSNTLIVFLSDSGANAEELSESSTQDSPFISSTLSDKSPVLIGNTPQAKPGTVATFQSYGVPWANVSNTPFRGYAKTLYEGGLRAPCILSWGENIAVGKLNVPIHVIDLYPTIVAATDNRMPNKIHGKPILEPVGKSFCDLFLLETRLHADEGETRRNYDRFFFWECDGHQSVRHGKWKLIQNRGSDYWELYNLVTDPTEQHDVYSKDYHRPEIQTMFTELERWKTKNHVYEWEQVRKQYIKVLKKEEEERARAQKRGN